MTQYRAQGRGGRPRRLRDRRAPQPAVRRVVPDHPPRLHRGADREAAALHEHDADHHQRPGEDRRGLRVPAAPLRRPRRPDDGPRQHRPGLPVVRQGHPRRHQARGRELPPAAQALARAGRQLAGPVPHAAAGLHLDARAARRHAALRVARVDPQHRDRRAGGLLRRRLLPQPHLLEQGAHRADGEALPPPLRALRPRRRRPGLRRPRRPGLHGLHRGGGQARSSGPTSTTPRSTATARRWRTSPR